MSSVAAGSEASQGSDVKALLVFELGDHRYALETHVVQEVVRSVAVRSLPRAPAVVEGVIDVRGTVVPVFDLRSRFRLPARASSTDDHFILGHAGARLVAVRADRALTVTSVPSASVRDLSVAVPDAGYLAGVATLPDGLVFIHDLGGFLSDAEARSLEAALES